MIHKLIVPVSRIWIICWLRVVFHRMNIISIILTIDGKPLPSEDAIADYIASMLMLETDPVFYISYDGIYTTRGTTFYEFRCHR